MGYYQHQSFHLRLNWLRKGIAMLKQDNRFFYDPEAAEKIGLGKNMVQSLKFWMLATNIAEESKDQESHRTIHLLTSLGKLIDQYDPYIDYVDTASLLHFQLIDDKEPNTVCYWFFNCLNKKTASKEELVDDFEAWVLKNEEKPTSKKSLSKDIDCLIRLYFNKESSLDPEDVTQSPISILNLISEEKGVVSKNLVRHESVGYTTLLYTLLVYGQSKERLDLTIDEIESETNLWGKVFHLSRREIIRALEQLEKHREYPISFQRTNRLNTIRLPEVKPLEFLLSEYKNKEKLFV